MFDERTQNYKEQDFSQNDTSKINFTEVLINLWTFQSLPPWMSVRCLCLLRKTFKRRHKEIRRLYELNLFLYPSYRVLAFIKNHKGKNSVGKIFDFGEDLGEVRNWLVSKRKSKKSNFSYFNLKCRYFSILFYLL